MPDNMWGTDPCLVDADEFCQFCEHSTEPDSDGTLHYEGCTR